MAAHAYPQQCTDGHHSPASDSSSSSPTAHSLPYDSSPMPTNYPYSAGLVPAPPLRTKRHQVKVACTKCQKACKKCDTNRPCLRCTRYGNPEECIDSQRKERKKGIKRGPYKKRDGKGNADYGVPHNGTPHQQAPGLGVPPATDAGYPLGYPPSPATPPAPTEMAAPHNDHHEVYYDQNTAAYYFAPVPIYPHQQLHGQSADPAHAAQSPHYAATALASYTPPYDGSSFAIHRPGAPVPVAHQQQYYQMHMHMLEHK